MLNFAQPDFFNLYLELPTAELEWEFEASHYLAPADIEFLVNPRRLRGSDFLMRWATVNAKDICGQKW